MHVAMQQLKFSNVSMSLSTSIHALNLPWQLYASPCATLCLARSWLFVLDASLLPVLRSPSNLDYASLRR
jgi:hypothetical protein